MTETKTPEYFMVTLDMTDDGEDFTNWIRPRGITFKKIGNCPHGWDTEFRGSKEALTEMINTWWSCGDPEIDHHSLDAITQIPQHWQGEFGGLYAPPAEILDLLLLPGVQDDSYHNDVMAHLGFYSGPVVVLHCVNEPDVELWWSAIEVQDREFPEEKRFMVTVQDDEGALTTVLSTDDAHAAAEKFIELAHKAEHAAAAKEKGGAA